MFFFALSKLPFPLFIINSTENMQVPSEEVKCVNDWRRTTKFQANLVIKYLPVCINLGRGIWQSKQKKRLLQPVFVSVVLGVCSG